MFTASECPPTNRTRNAVAVTLILVEVWGAGGSARSDFGGSSSNMALGRGGAGGYNKGIINVIPGSTHLITIGNEGFKGSCAYTNNAGYVCSTSSGTNGGTS